MADLGGSSVLRSGASSTDDWNDFNVFQKTFNFDVRSRQNGDSAPPRNSASLGGCLGGDETGTGGGGGGTVLDLIGAATDSTSLQNLVSQLDETIKQCFCRSVTAASCPGLDPTTTDVAVRTQEEIMSDSQYVYIYISYIYILCPGESGPHIQYAVAY